MGDGHTGISNTYKKHVQKDKFDLAFSYLKERDTGGYFVVHVLPKVTYEILTPADFLEMLGFKQSPHICQPFARPCYYKYVFEREIDGWQDDAAVQHAHGRFDRFAESIDDIFAMARRVVQLVGDHVEFFPWAKKYSTAPQVLDISQTEPSWLDAYRVEEYRTVLQTVEDARKRRDYFRTVEYCLWGTGDPLVDSVHFILSSLGLKPEKTERGATVDLILPLPSPDVLLGIEVTGLNEAIKKRTKKLNQALAFLQESEEARKALILANTYNDTPLQEREGLEHFTKDATHLMAGIGIVGLTTIDLYRIWRDVKYGDADITQIMGEICGHPGGVYHYSC